MEYGYPFFTSKKPPRAHAEALARLFADARFAWNEPRHRWEVVQRTPSGRWARTMICGPEITTKVFDHLKRVKRIHAKEEALPEEDAAAASAQRDADRQDADRKFEMGRRMYKPLMRHHRIPHAATAAFQGKAAADFVSRPSGLLVPKE